jgi:hypothetical protein
MRTDTTFPFCGYFMQKQIGSSGVQNARYISRDRKTEPMLLQRV